MCIVGFLQEYLCLRGASRARPSFAPHHHSNCLRLFKHISAYYRGEDEERNHKRATLNTWCLHFVPNSHRDCLYKCETGYYLHSFNNWISTRETQSINGVSSSYLKNRSFFFALKRIANYGKVFLIWKLNFSRTTWKLVFVIFYFFANW